MGEQSGEFIHNRFNRLWDSHNKTKDVDQRLQILVKQYIYILGWYPPCQQMTPSSFRRSRRNEKINEPVILKIRLMINIYFFRKSRLKQKAGNIVFKSLLASENGCGGGWKHFRGFDNPVKNANENLSIHCSSAF